MKKMLSLLLLVFVAIATQSFFSQSPTQASYQKGKSLYETHCMSCHMEDGNGLESVYPSLVKTGNLADKNKMAKIVLLGMRGKIVVKGITYDSEMAGIALTDKEAADVINYIRNSWGNKAPYIKAADVALAKKATLKGYRPY